MNDNVLAAYERAARIYCEKRSIDPEEMRPAPDQVIAGVPKLAPVWHFVATELHDLSLRLLSLREAARPPANDEVH